MTRDRFYIVERDDLGKYGDPQGCIREEVDQYLSGLDLSEVAVIWGSEIPIKTILVLDEIEGGQHG